jgi:hypothetical protein
MRPALRLFGICATDADVVAIVRRGPSAWTHLGMWDLASEQFHSGSWLRARVYQQKCDVSPDGTYFCYSALNGGAQWDAGDTYIAVSRLPWFTALAAWSTQGTYDWGAHFVEDRARWDLPEPDEGDDGPLRRRYGLAMTDPQHFAVERRRGWTDLPASAQGTQRHRVGRQCAGQFPRRQHDLWLLASGESRPRYELRDRPSGPVLNPLDDVQWADWARDGRLLVATTDGRLQIRDGTTGVVGWELSLAELTPTPQRPPAQARRW